MKTIEKMRVAGILWGLTSLFFTSAHAQSCLNCYNATNSGLYSNALGPFSVASGESSFAFGQNARATNYRSIAIGTSTLSTGMSSFAIGNLVKSSGYNAIVMGMGSSAGLLENPVSNSLMVGFNSIVPTLFVGPASDIPNGFGKVGIGTITPGEMLTVNGTVESKSGGFRFPDGTLQTTKAFSPWIKNSNNLYYTDGFVGIGLTKPTAKLDVYGDIVLGKPGENFILHSRSWVGDALVIAPQNNNGGWDWSKSITLKDNGQVYIGSELSVTSPHLNYKLAVNGKIVCKELIVTLQCWADEVFTNSYRLMPLTDLEHYIFENHHLPGIPAEKEVISLGMDVGEINRTLLAKIEELTLYTIQLNRELTEVKQSLKTQMR